MHGATDQPVVLVTPLMPAASGNGLAMRAGMLLDALCHAGAVDLVVVPVAGSSGNSDWAAARARHITVVDPVAAEGADEHAVAQLADPELRDLLTRTAPLPWRARLAPPTLARDLALPDNEARVVLVLREYLVPFGLTLARRLNASRTVIDLDDDVEPLLRALGDTDDAEAYGRLARAWLPRADAVIAASEDEAGAIAARYGLSSVHAVPNAYAAARALPPPPGHDRMLFVGNLTYPPNVAAAQSLAHDVLPELRRLRPAATVDLVGAYDVRLAAVGKEPGVHLRGFVADLVGAYAAADVIVAPMRLGAGTRIKILEAFAYGRPVIATPQAVAGLHVRDGVEVLLGDTPAEVAACADRVLGDPALASALTGAAARTLAAHYAPDVVAPLVRRVVLGEGTESS